jgi:hypothetical protein
MRDTIESGVPLPPSYTSQLLLGVRLTADCSGRATSGGKPDDITVIAAVISNNSKL